MAHLPETKKNWKIYADRKWDFIYRNELDKLVFDMIGLMANQKTLKDKTLKIASDPKYDGYQRGLASMVYKFFDKKFSGNGVATEPNYYLANELNRQIIRKFKKRKVYSSFRENIWDGWFSWYAITEHIQERNQVFIVCNWSF